jgi:hypothetical protein
MNADSVMEFNVGRQAGRGRRDGLNGIRRQGPR